VKREAIKAANARKAPVEPLAWSEALAEAPVPKFTPPAFEAVFRREYAAQLVKLEHAKKAAQAGRPGKSGKGGTTDLLRRTVYLTQDEIEDQDSQAGALGLSWSTWARRKLAT
jgi:hypothetical protein